MDRSIGVVAARGRCRGPAIVACCAVCVIAAPGRADAPSPRERVQTVAVRSPALVSNKVGDDPARRVLVYLPPSYARQAERRFPVLYLLHGATSTPDEWVDGTYPGLDLAEAMDGLVRQGAVPEFIVVMPDANNRLGASFYVNSSATGGWEDFIVRDLVGFIDAAFRTDASMQGRALAGHSVGGFGALAIGFRHPSVFGSVYAMSPCCLTFDGFLAPAHPGWGKLGALRRWQDADTWPGRDCLRLAMAAALLGDATSPRLFREVPFGPDAGGRMSARGPVLSRWQARMPLELATRLVDRRDRRPRLVLDFGTRDELAVTGVAALRRRLDSLGFPYTVESFAGGHVDHMRERITGHLLPTVGRWLFTPERAEAR